MSEIDDLSLQLEQKEEIVYRLTKRLQEAEDENRKLQRIIDKLNKRSKAFKSKMPSWRYMQEFDNQVTKYEKFVAATEEEDAIQTNERPRQKRSDNLLKNYFDEIKEKEERLKNRLLEIQGEKTRLKCHYSYDIHDVDLVLHQKSREIQHLIDRLHGKNSRINEKIGKIGNEIN